MKKIIYKIFVVISLILFFILGISLFIPGQTDFHYVKSTKGLIRQAVILVNALEIFNKDMGRYPSTEEGLQVLIFSPPNNPVEWKGPYITKALLISHFKGDLNKDVWGSRYIYLYPAQYGSEPYDLYSCGKNRVNNLGQKDDITNWKEVNKAYYKDKEIRDDSLKLLVLSLISLIIVIWILAR